jgi:hypothetical protein
VRRHADGLGADATSDAAGVASRLGADTDSDAYVRKTRDENVGSPPPILTAASAESVIGAIGQLRRKGRTRSEPFPRRFPQGGHMLEPLPPLQN